MLSSKTMAVIFLAKTPFYQGHKPRIPSSYFLSVPATEWDSFCRGWPEIECEEGPAINKPSTALWELRIVQAKGAACLSEAAFQPQGSVEEIGGEAVLGCQDKGKKGRTKGGGMAASVSFVPESIDSYLDLLKAKVFKRGIFTLKKKHSLDCFWGTKINQEVVILKLYGVQGFICFLLKIKAKFCTEVIRMLCLQQPNNLDVAVKFTSCTLP